MPYTARYRALLSVGRIAAVQGQVPATVPPAQRPALLRQLGPEGAAYEEAFRRPFGERGGPPASRRQGQTREEALWAEYQTAGAARRAAMWQDPMDGPLLAHLLARTAALRGTGDPVGES